MSSMSKVENHECCCLWVWLTIKHVKTLVLRATLDHSPIIVHRGTGTALRSRPENAILDRNTGRFRSCSVKMHHRCRSSFLVPEPSVTVSDPFVWGKAHA